MSNVTPSTQGLFPSSPSVTSGQAPPRVINTTGTVTLNILAADAFGGVSIYQTPACSTTVQLPSGSGPFPIFDGSLNCTAHPITVLPPAGLTINGATSDLIAFNGQSVTYYNDGTQIVKG